MPTPLEVIEMLDPTQDELKYAFARALEELDELQVAHDRYQEALRFVSKTREGKWEDLRREDTDAAFAALHPSDEET